MTRGGPITGPPAWLRRLFPVPEGPALEAVAGLVEAWKQGHTGLRVGDPGTLAALAGSRAVAEGLDPRAPKPLVLRHGLLQSARHCGIEQELAARLRGLAAAPASPLSAEMRAAFERLYPNGQDPQARAVRVGLERRLALITGGPGTGKTHCAARLLALKLLERPQLRFALCAPTGKAAQRLAESVGRAAAGLSGPAEGAAGALRTAGVHAGTLHRLLEWRPDEDHCGRDAQRPLSVDLVLVDEASMLDLMLWRALLRALPEGASLVVLGDPCQLESIEPGRVLGGLIEAARASKALQGCHVELIRNHRFAERPGIGALAQAVRVQTRDGDPRAVLDAAPEATGAAGEAADRAEVLRYNNAALDAALARVWPDIRRLAEATDGAAALEALEGLRILCALNEGRWGVAGLNGRIQARLAREGLALAAHPILVGVNDPHSGLFNGDLGALIPGSGGDAGGKAYFRGPGGVKAYAWAQLPEHRQAWAMTVHRSQGSEYRSILLVLPPPGEAGEAHELLRRELLYTAVTRAQERVLIVADEAVLVAASRPGEARVTGLGQWLGG